MEQYTTARRPFKLVGGVIVGVLVASFILLTFYTVEQYERGVLKRFGKVVEVVDPGLHFKVPLMHSVTIYRTDILSIAAPEAVNTYTIDNQEVDVLFNVQYRILPQNVAFVYENVQDYEARMYKMAEDRLKAEMGKVNTQDVSENRGKIRDTIKAVLAHDFKTIGLEVVDFQLTNIEYDKQFKAAVQAAASAKAGVETREQERIQAIKIAEKAKIDAEGRANAIREIAKAEAEAVKIKGEAEAASIRAQAVALQENQKLVELRKAERWDGKLPVWPGNNIVPFMNIAPTDGSK